MVRRTLLAVFPLLQDTKEDITKLQTEVFQHFYKVSIGEIPDLALLEKESAFSSILYDPSSRDLFMYLHADTLVFILSIRDKVGYIGVSRDVFSREWSIELPSTLSWEDLVECAKQTPQSLISFS